MAWESSPPVREIAMKSRLQLTATLLEELGRECSVDPSRDLRRLRECVEHRGESFLTITLPDFCSDFERCLDRGRLDPGAFIGPFGARNSAGKPGFLRGFLDLVFDNSGVLRTTVPPNVVFAIRQVCLLHKKSWAIANESRQTRAVKGYLSAEAEITEQFNDPDGYFRRTAAVVVQDVFQRLLSKGAIEGLVGKHGPGATAEGFTSNQKWNFSVWHDRLEDVFPYSRHAVHDESVMLEREIQDRVVFRPKNEEQPVKVVFVPKTMKTPRVIAIEPACMQFAQQAILKALVPVVEDECEFTKGRINFSDQSVNQRLALEASQNRRLATLDMKEASDRVSYACARELFKVAPALWELLDASRSTHARLPDGQVVPLKKFASMGSATCFPVEALAFYIAIVSSRLRERGLRVGVKTVREYGRDVYVYGDDIVCPADEAESICVSLESFGFRVNVRKSFWTGWFRESCGVDAYQGSDVTPTYCRYAPPGRTDSEALVSWVAMANGFYAKGLWSTARAVRSFIEEMLGELPVSARTLGGLSWSTFSRYSSPGRWDSKTHVVKRKSWIPSTVKRKDPVDSYAALLKCLSELSGRSSDGVSRLLDPSPKDDEHLFASVRRHALALKRGWIPVS